MLKRQLLLACGLLGLTVLRTWPQAVSMNSGVSDMGDPLLNTWTLAWVAHAIASDPANLLNANIFFPERVTLAFSEPLLLPGILLAPLQWLGADPIFSHNVLLFLGYVLSGLAAFALLYTLTGDTTAGVIAAVAVTASPLRTEYYPKVQLQLIFWTPLALTFLHRALKTNSLRDSLLLGVCLAFQFYTCVYYAIAGAFFVAAVGTVALLTSHAGQLLRYARLLAPALVLAILLVIPLASAFAAASKTVGERTLRDTAPYSATLSDYRTAHPENWLHGSDQRPGLGERRLFPGYAVLILAMAGLATGRVALAYFLASVACLWLSLGINGPGYAWLHQHVEPLRAIRVPARFAMFVDLGLCILAGLGTHWLLARRPRIRTAVAIALVAVIAAEGQDKPLELSRLPERQPDVYRWLQRQPAGVVCEYPFGRLEGRIGPQDATYGYYSTIHWQPLLNGYSGFQPPSYDRSLSELSAFPGPHAVEYLAAAGVKYLLVHQRFYIKGDFTADIEQLRRDPGVTWMATFRWHDGQRTEVFGVSRR